MFLVYITKCLDHSFTASRFQSGDFYERKDQF